MDRHSSIEKLINCINLEEQEEAKRFKIENNASIKQLKAEGVVIHPITLNKMRYGLADYPECTFHISFPFENRYFKDGCAIELFFENEEPIKGMLLYLNDRKGELRLFSNAFPDWIDEKKIGIKLSPDFKTNTRMKEILEAIPSNKRLNNWFEKLHNNTVWNNQINTEKTKLTLNNLNLNESQKDAVQQIVENDSIAIVHGPPGTGKTTTLVEAIQQLVAKGEKVLVSAPTNTAVDHITKSLIAKGLEVLRVGNQLKMDDQLYDYSFEGKMRDSKEFKEIKRLKIKSEEFRKLATQYKRNFGKEERDQRNLLLNETKSIRKEIRSLRNYAEDNLYKEAEVVLGTPIGLNDFIYKSQSYQTVIIDEAGQCLEPLAWVLFQYAEKVVLAGDHFQLPPVIFSDEAIKLGYNKSILEVGINQLKNISFLDVQYRMPFSIIEFSNNYFYDGKIKSFNQEKEEFRVSFIDTAGTGYVEEFEEEGSSILNLEEIELTEKLIEQEQLDLKNTVIISPYSAQVGRLKETFEGKLLVRTIDSFQGQEVDYIIISLVRSNEEGQIGFLSDYRRMNVAMTRAKKHLYVIGDSATLAGDKFYAQFLDFVEKNGGYKSAWEYLYD